ncbi:uncharacterized protein TNCV_3676891 [Trichonephila clavipes]|nr:uncharacterized protein TNCV_3676891 [Trichonephila clavipes]
MRYFPYVGCTENNGPKTTTLDTPHVSIPIPTSSDVGHRDHQQRIDFINEYLIRYDSDNDWLLRTLRTDEAHFTLTSNINSKNCICLADTNLQVVAPVSLYNAKATVWCGIAGTIILGPHFSEKGTPKSLKRAL